MSYLCYPLPIELDAVLHYGKQLGLTSADQSLSHLAQAIALHPMWQNFSQGMLIARSHPTPVLAAIGIFSPKSLGQIKIQQSSLNHACRRLRYITYAEATIACEQLTEQLLNHFGPQAIREFQFCGIPRGGLIILGMLAYTLGLRPEQLTPPYSTAVPLVVVDDCALSGSRLTGVLKQYPQHSLVFAPLYAHPDLRHNILKTEPQILHCLSGKDLQDYGPELIGDSYPEWQIQNLARLVGHRYWLGLPDYICFPWNEPDHLLWNPMTSELERSWRIIPPTACLKNRPSPPNRFVQHQPQVSGWLRPTAHIVFGTLHHQSLIGNLSTGETFGLSGQAARYWSVILTSPTLESAIATLTPQNRQSDSILHSELTAFIEQLIHQNILSPAG